VVSQDDEDGCAVRCFHLTDYKWNTFSLSTSWEGSKVKFFSESPVNMKTDTPENEGNVLFPVFFKLHQLHILVVGGGYVGLEKLEAILRNSPLTQVTLVGKEILQPKIFELAQQHPSVKVIEKPFRKKYLKNMDLVFLATNDRKLHEKIKIITHKRHLMTNVADTPDLCDFYLSSIVKKGDLKIAISSNGKSPTLTKRIREYLEESLPDDVQSLLDNLENIRSQLKGDFEYKVQKLNEVTSQWLENQTLNKNQDDSNQNCR
jgi:precorrin-2 dehydrogenase / sirohydrochlorin ferrochelatase